MNYILIIGTKDAGKSTTIAAICEALKPTSVKSLDVQTGILTDDSLENIFNNTFLINVSGKAVLIVAGAPTEQKFRITIIIEVFIKLKIKIDFALVAMRSSERLEGFDTVNELAKFGECILQERIWKIEEENFRQSKEWKNRINRYTDLIHQNW
jgi:energy-coupling factor transporter ATP-binding protein EcfA2